MLKFQLMIADTANEKEVHLFHSAEALYEWMQSPVPITDDMLHVSNMMLYPGEKAEYEWIGCEFIHTEGEKHIGLHLVKFAAARKSQNESGTVIMPAVGWVCEGLLPLREYSDNIMTITKIDDGTIDFKKAFANFEL